MRSSKEIQNEYDNMKKPSQGKGQVLDTVTDQAYQEAIRRAKLEEQVQEQRNFEVQVEQIMNRPSTP